MECRGLRTLWCANRVRTYEQRVEECMRRELVVVAPESHNAQTWFKPVHPRYAVSVQPRTCYKSPTAEYTPIGLYFGNRISCCNCRGAAPCFDTYIVLRGQQFGSFDEFEPTEALVGFFNHDARLRP